MSVATVESNGLITIPEDIRDLLKLVPGSQVEFVRRQDGVYTIVPVGSTAS